MQSIYYAKMSLEFDMDVEDKKTRIKYIQMRYKDIADCRVLDDEVRFRAYEIYYAMDNLLDTSSSTVNFEDNKIDMRNQLVIASYDMNTVQSYPSGIDVLIKAETSFPADHATIYAKPESGEITEDDILNMHGGKYEWYFKANFYIKGTYTVTITAYNSEVESVSDEFTYVY